jgi:hypothetical protein
MSSKTSGAAKESSSSSCGFFGFNVFVSEEQLRETIGFKTKDEHNKWLNPDRSLRMEGDNSQFGLLVGYWLSSIDTIRPTTLQALVTNSVDPSVDYGDLLNSTASDADVSADASRVTDELLAGVPDKASPNGLNSLIEEALHKARLSRLDNPEQPKRWSAAFVVSVIRGSAIHLGLEAMNGNDQMGVNKLLKITKLGAHRVYVVEAYNRMRNGITGTYHAFTARDHVPQVGDIIIQDPRKDIDISEVVAFNDISTGLANQNLHGDIVVEAYEDSDYVVTIGGNIGGPPREARGSVRRRCYPLDASRHLIINRVQQYVNEDDSGTLPSIPPTSNASGLGSHSTGRIFALLSPVQECNVIPG